MERELLVERTQSGLAAREREAQRLYERSR